MFVDLENFDANTDRLAALVSGKWPVLPRPLSCAASPCISPTLRMTAGLLDIISLARFRIFESPLHAASSGRVTVASLRSGNWTTPPRSSPSIRHPDRVCASSPPRACRLSLSCFRHGVDFPVAYLALTGNLPARLHLLDTILTHHTTSLAFPSFPPVFLPPVNTFFYNLGYGKTIRIASKSVRVPALIARALNRHPDVYQGMLLYNSCWFAGE